MPRLFAAMPCLCGAMLCQSFSTRINAQAPLCNTFPKHFFALPGLRHAAHCLFIAQLFLCNSGAELNATVPQPFSSELCHHHSMHCLCCSDHYCASALPCHSLPTQIFSLPRLYESVRILTSPCQRPSLPCSAIPPPDRASPCRRDSSLRYASAFLYHAPTLHFLALPLLCVSPHIISLASRFHAGAAPTRFQIVSMTNLPLPVARLSRIAFDMVQGASPNAFAASRTDSNLFPVST